MTCIDAQIHLVHYRDCLVILMCSFCFLSGSHVERTKILEAFKTSKDVNTIFLSKV